MELKTKHKKQKTNLIVTADDFGRSSQINAAVIEAHRHGILTSASLMSGGDAFEEAVQLARQTPTLAVGLHVVVVDGKAVLPRDRLPGLLNEEGWFADDPVRLGVRYFFNDSARAMIAAEVAAQFARFAATGLTMAHVDGHQHMHLHPAIFPLIVSLAGRYNAAGIRLPHDELQGPLEYDRRDMLAKMGRAASLGILSCRGRSLLRGRPFATAGRVYGLSQTGRMDEAYVVKLLQTMKAKSAEIYFHPTLGPRIGALGPNPDDLATLLSPRVREVIESRGIRLCNYVDLLQRQP